MKGAIVLEDQARFHPRKFALAIAKAISAKDGKGFDTTRATDVKKRAPQWSSRRNTARSWRAADGAGRDVLGLPVSRLAVGSVDGAGSGARDEGPRAQRRRP